MRRRPEKGTAPHKPAEARHKPAEAPTKGNDTMSKDNTNTAAETVAKFDYQLDELDAAVIAQLGGTSRNVGDYCEISEDAAEELVNVLRCSCGAAGGFPGFVYYTETREFTAKNRAAIVARLHEQIDGGFFTDENGKPRGVVGAVVTFSCFKDENPDEIEEEAARVLFGPLEDVRGGDLDRVANALAWAALEDLAFRLDGQRIDDDETAND